MNGRNYQKPGLLVLGLSVLAANFFSADKDAEAAARRYAAETISKEARAEGIVEAGGMTWNCKGNYCATTDLAPQGMDIPSCTALAGEVGPLSYYGLRDKSRFLGRKELDRCNGALRSVTSPEPAEGGAGREPADELARRIPRLFDPKAGGMDRKPGKTPSLDSKISTKATTTDLFLSTLGLTDTSLSARRIEDTRVGVLVRVRNLGGVAPEFIIATTGDAATPDRLIRSAPGRVPPGAFVDIPLELYINPAHVEDGIFRALVWLGTVETPLVYADANRDNNLKEISFEVEPRPRARNWSPPPRTIGRRSDDTDDGGGGCDADQIGEACEVRPDECSGSRAGWTAPGTLRCVGGELRCEARAQTDYCTSCGGVCGACANTTCCPGPGCPTASLCAPGATCIDNRSIRERPFCQDLNIDYVARRTGSRVCTHIPNFCWTPEEVGLTHIICREAEGWEKEEG